MSYDSVAKAIPMMSYEEQINLLSVLVEAVKSGINKATSAKKQEKDFTDSYPKGYFDLFGSDPDYPEEPEELSWDLEAKKEFF